MFIKAKKTEERTIGNKITLGHYKLITLQNGAQWGTHLPYGSKYED